MSGGDADPHPLAVPAGEGSEAAPRALLPTLKGQSAASPALPGQGLLVLDPAGVFSACSRHFSLLALGKASPAFPTLPVFTCHRSLAAVAYL